MSRIRSARPKPDDTPSSICPSCGKIRYLSKSDAKKSTRRQGRQRSRYYQCGDYWHATHWAPADHVRWYRERQ